MADYNDVGLKVSEVEAFIKWIDEMPEEAFNFLNFVKCISFARGVYDKNGKTYYYLRIILPGRKERQLRVSDETQLLRDWGFMHELKKIDKAVLALRSCLKDSQRRGEVIQLLQRTFVEAKKLLLQRTFEEREAEE